MSTEKTINSTIRTNLLSNEDFVYAHLVKFERPFSKKADGTYPTDDSRYGYYTDGSHDIVFGGNTYYANRILSVGNYSETTQARASAMSLTLAGEDLKPAISVPGSISTSGVFTPTSTTYEGYALDFVERGFKEGDEISFTYDSTTTITYRIASFTTNNTVLNLAVIGTSPDIVNSFPGSTLSKTFTIKIESDEITAPLQDRGITVDGTSAASPSFVNRTVLIEKVFIDPETGTPWGNASITIFKGVIQNVSIDEKPTGVQVKWGLTSHWGDWNEVGGRITTDEIHRTIKPNGQPAEEQPIRNEYAGDLGFLHAETSLSAIANYKTEQTRTRMKAKRRGGLAGATGGKYYVQEEFQVDIENEVDLNIHLQGKYLPVVYGVQRINGNPVFADTLNYNSQKVYTADAICEGEVHGLLNIYVDDMPLICTDDNDFEVRGPSGSDKDNTQLQCFGRMSYGNTLGGRKGAELEIHGDDQGGLDLTYDVLLEVGQRQAAYAGVSIEQFRMINDWASTALIVGSNGLLHRESWSIDHPYPIDQSFFQGRPNQLASAMLNEPARVTDGIQGVRVTNAGRSFTSVPNVEISAPSGGGTRATGTAVLTNDDEGNPTKVGSITITNAGSGYTDSDTVTVSITGGGGSGAAAEADRGGYKRQSDYYTGNAPYWSSNHRLLDTVYTANQFEIDAESTELPEIEYVVKGSVLDCFNYDNTYVPDTVLGTSNTHTNFVEGDLVTVEYSTDGSSWTTDTSGNYSGQFKIMDKFLFNTNRSTSEYRFRLDKTPALAVTNGSPSRTRLRLVDSSNNYWYMITWNHTLCTNQSFPDEFKDPTWAQADPDSGDITAEFSASDATALGNTGTNNVYQFYSDDWSGLPKMEHAILSGTWSGNTLTFKAGLLGLTSAALTNFNDHVKVRLGTEFDLTSVSAVASITDAKELVSTYSNTDISGNSATYVGRGCLLKNETTGEEREIQKFIPSTDVVTIDTPFFTPPLSSHKFTITGRGADKRSSINPAIQTLDYIRNKRYGKGLEDTDLDIDTFITSAKLCDSRSDITISLEDASGVAINDIYQLKSGGDANSGTLVAEGKVTKISGNKVTFTEVINKFTKQYSTYGTYQHGDIIYTNAGRYYRADTSVTYTSTVDPSHTSGTQDGLIFLGTSTDGTNSDLTLHKASGSGPSTIKMSKTQGNPVEYALYDSDFVTYWKYYGWERNHQAEVTRHQTNFILDTGKSKFENINTLLSHFNGILSYENGKYVLDVETQESAPTASLNASQENINPYYIENSDIIGNITLKDDSQKKAKNTIKSSVADPQLNWGSRSITFFNSDFLKADRDVVKTANFPFTGITNYFNGRIGVEKELFQSRFSKEINFTIGPRGLLLKVGQVIALTYDSFGFSSKLFRINNLNFNSNCTVTIKATEYDDSIYEITKQQANTVNQQSSANFTIKPLDIPTLSSVTTDKAGSIILNWTNGANFNEITDSTEIFASADNNRSNADLIAIVDNTQTYTHTTASQDTFYYWIRHRRKTSPRGRTQITHSGYNPTSATNGTQGISLSLSSGATTITLKPSTHVIDYSKGGVENTSVTFTTQTFNTTGTIYYEFLVNDQAPTGGAVNGLTSTFTLPQADEPAVDGTPITVTVKARQSAVDGTLLGQDTVTIHSIQDGQDTVTGILTNETHTIPAATDGTVSGSDLGNAGGTFNVFYGNALQNGNVADNKISFSVASESGVDVSIDENSGVYTVSSVSANSGTATFSCTLEGSLVGGVDNTDDVTVTKTYTIAKATAGTTGTASAIVYAYQRSSSSLSSNPGDVTVSLAGTSSGTITTGSLANGWLKEIPSGSDDLYVCAATASGTGTTDTVAASEWSSPVLLTQTGADGLNTATVNIYQRTSSSTAPSSGSNSGLPEGASTYTFANSTLSFTTANGWSLTNPGINDANPYLWISHATAASTGNTDSIAQTEWSTPVLLSQKGDTGATGAVGKTVRLFADDYSIVYDAAGSNPTPSTSTDIVLTATTQNFTNPYFKFTGDGISDETDYSDGLSAVHDTFTFPVPASHFTSPQTIKVSVQEGASGGEVASDTISIFAVKPGADGDDAFTVICSNETHAIPADADGSNPSMGGSGTSFEVLRGTTQLTGITSGTPNSSQFKVTVTDDTNITAGSQSAGSNLITFADHTSMSAATASITYAVLIANTNTITKKQTFSRTNKGATGATGASAKTVFYRKSGTVASRYGEPSSPSGNITATSIVNQWGTVFVAPDANNVVWQSIGNSADGTNWTWGAPFLYLPWSEIELGFELNQGFDFDLTGLDKIGLTDNNYKNDQITLPDSTSGSGTPTATKPNGSTYLQTNVTPNILFIRVNGSWTSTANINSDTNTTNYNELSNLPSLFDGAYDSLSGTKPPSNANAYVLPSDVLKGTISVNGTTITIPKNDGSTYNITTQDTNTQYSAGDFNITNLAGYSAAAYANSSITTYVIDKDPFLIWSALGDAANIAGPSQNSQWTISWFTGGSSAGTTVIQAAYAQSGTSMTVTNHTQVSNSASASVSLSTGSGGSIKTSTVTKGGVTVTLTSQAINGIEWSFNKE